MMLAKYHLIKGGETDTLWMSLYRMPLFQKAVG